ncbi:MAG: PQQ-dependent sugar dehydrogenase [Paracoccaceae bacterium]
MRPIAILIALLAAFSAAQAAPVEQGPKNVPEFRPAFQGQTRAPEDRSGVHLKTEVFVDGLSHPWGIAPLPGGGYLVTERPGRLRVIGADGALSAPIDGLPRVFARRQGGLLDVAVGPSFAQDRVIYFTYAKPMGGGRSATAAARAVLSPDGRELSRVRDIFVQTPPSPTPAHYGSRILFDGAGHAFITTGEHFTQAERQKAQDTGIPYGKVIRVALDGGIPADNPFGNAVWSYGHRNIQGAAIRPGTGQLWTVEHGPRGGDELNRIEPGRNYGWPVISYGENYDGSPVGQGLTTAEGMEQPVYYWDPVIAPGGMQFYDGTRFGAWRGDLLIASLTPGGLVRLSLENGRVTGEERFLRGTRLRDVQVAPDGSVLVLVDAEPGGILRLTPE